MELFRITNCVDFITKKVYIRFDLMNQPLKPQNNEELGTIHKIQS